MNKNGLGPLIRINGRFDSERYEDILDDIVLPYLEEQYPDDNFYYYQSRKARSGFSGIKFQN